jgi:hypothetical protein
MTLERAQHCGEILQRLHRMQPRFPVKLAARWLMPALLQKRTL